MAQGDLDGAERAYQAALAADRAHGTVTHDSEGRANVHARHEAVRGRSLLVRPLIDQPDADDAVTFQQRTCDGR